MNVIATFSRDDHFGKNTALNDFKIPYNKKYSVYRVDEHKREAPGEHVGRAHLGPGPQPHEHGTRRRQRSQHQDTLLEALRRQERDREA